ncbi:hypothetical protein DHODJN_23710 [Methylorubrum extorquens]
MQIAQGAYEQIGHLQLRHFVGAYSLHSLDNLTREIICIVAKYFVQLLNLFIPSRIFYINVYPMLRRWAEKHLKHVEVSFIIKAVMILTEVFMAQDSFIGNNQSPKAKIIVIKEIIDVVHVKPQLRWTDFCPFYFKVCWHTVAYIDLSKPFRYLSPLLDWAPNGS